MDLEERFANLCLALGLVLGSLRDPDVITRLRFALHSGNLHRPYVEAVRDTLDRVLKEAAEP